MDRLDTEINAGYGDEGFSFNDSGLISDNPEWRGWMGMCNNESPDRYNADLVQACDWYHGVPQVCSTYYSWLTDFANLR